MTSLFLMADTTGSVTVESPKRAKEVIGVLLAALFVTVFVTFVVELAETKPFKVDSQYELFAAISVAMGALAALATWRRPLPLSSFVRIALCAVCFVTVAWILVAISFAFTGVVAGARLASDFGKLACLREWLKLSVLLVAAEAPVAACWLLVAVSYRQRWGTK